MVTILPAEVRPTRRCWRVTMMTPSRGTCRWTLIGPGCGWRQLGGRDARAVYTGSLVGGDWRGQGLGQDSVVDDVDEVPVEAEGDLLAGQSGADLQAVFGQVGDDRAPILGHLVLY